MPHNPYQPPSEAEIAGESLLFKQISPGWVIATITVVVLSLLAGFILYLEFVYVDPRLVGPVPETQADGQVR